MIKILYPENKLVAEDTIVIWYRDAIANNQIAGDIDANVNASDAAIALDDAGLITLAAQPFVNE